ncbi:MAG: DUF1294 domain-containing protein [Acholeplasmatales bacterium]|nr:DUF1294 domain-containing protein [Acholeplasmatales bacterium]
MGPLLYVLIGYVGYLVLLSIITLFLFFKDKNMAKNGGGAVRIKEKTLLGFTALGGAIGAFFGRILAHHKTDKIYFSMVIYFSLLLEAAVLGALIAFTFVF